jgi:hypothetical protein
LHALSAQVTDNKLVDRFLRMGMTGKCSEVLILRELRAGVFVSVVDTGFTVALFPENCGTFKIGADSIGVIN